MAAKTGIGWSLAVAGALAVGPLVLGRGNPALNSAREEISRMSEVERTALKRKYDQYRNLPEEKRAELRTLHQELEADRTNGARSLSTMADYCDWLKTIDAWQQDELAHITDPQARAKRVDEIVKARKEAELAAESASNDRLPAGNGRAPVPLLNEDQLTKVFDVLAKRLTGLTDVEQQQIDALHGLKRFGVQIRHLKKTVSKPEQFFPSIYEADWTEMAEASGHAEFKALLSSPLDSSLRKRVAIHGILASCRDQFMRESASATDADLETFFNGLTSEAQDELLQLRADEFKTQLRLRRLENDPDISELRSVTGFSTAKRRMEKFLREGGRPNDPGGPPFGRPGDPNGDGPPPDGRREGGRSGPFRPGNGRRPFGDNPPLRPGDEGRPPAGSDGNGRPLREGGPPPDGDPGPLRRPQ